MRKTTGKAGKTKGVASLYPNGYNTGMTSNVTNAKGTTMQTIKIGGVEYEIVRTREFQHDGVVRTAMFLRRPAGKRIYHAVRYENGAVSGLTPV
jgi:hypothetical protein